MEKKGKLQSLDWLVEEVESCLQQAAEALESYLADPEDEAQIRFCLGYIHQVHGSLQIAESHGPILLSEEMELLAEQIQNGEVNSVTESCEVLVQAILRLPAYLRHVIATRKDQPETLLLLFNELRAVRGCPLVTEGAFFSPVMSHPVIGQAPHQHPNPEALSNLLRKLRQMYQFAVLGIIKGEKLNQNFNYVEKVITRLQELSKGTVNRPVWDIAKAFLENISGNNIPIGIAVKMLFRELDVQIKTLVRGGMAALNSNPPEPLLKNLLFYVAYGASSMPASVKVREQYRLDASLPEGFPDENGPQYEPETLRSIVKELDQELDQAKKNIERYVVEGGVDTGLLEDSNIILQRMSDSLAVVGELSLRNKIKDAQALIKRNINGEGGKDEMMSAATMLVEVETGLFSWLEKSQLGPDYNQLLDEQQVEVKRAQEALIREARNGLETIKESIVEFIASQWDRQCLEVIPPLIENVAGAMEILSLPRAKAILNNSNRYLVEQLLQGGMVPDWNSLDSLADAITSIDYYLEFIGNNDADSDDTVLAVAEKSVAGLGYPVDGEPLVAEKHQPEEADLPAEDESTNIVELRREPELETGSEIEVEPEVEAEPQVEETGRVEPEDAEEDSVDPEIVEVFVEEVDEVLSTINELLPEWQADLQNHKPLIDIRRSFHTLKGSGRMVAAEHIGDLGWSVESLLNKVLDNQLSATDGMVHLVEQAVAEIPAMIQQFQPSGDTQKTARVIQLIDLADALACGEEIVISPVEVCSSPGVEEDTGEVVDAVVEESATQLLTKSSTEEPPEQGVPSEQVDDLEEQEEPAGEAELPFAEPEMDDELVDIFVNEAAEQLRVIESFVVSQREEAPVYSMLSSETQSAMHTLKGSALMAGVDPVGRLMVPLEELVNDLYQYQCKADADIVELLADSATATRNYLQALEQKQKEDLVDLDSLLSRIEMLRASTIKPLLEQATEKPSVDPTFLQELMTAGMDKLLDAEELLETWQHSPEQLAPLFELQQELVLLHEASEQAGVANMSQASGLLGQVYDAICQRRVNIEDVSVDDLVIAQEALLRMIDQVAAMQTVDVLDSTLAERLESLAHQQAEPQTIVEEEGVATEQAAVVIDEIEIEALDTSNIDLDILQTFVLEADELLEESDQALGLWSDDTRNSQHPDAIKRALHTLKGGARMAGLIQLGDISHTFEDSIEALEATGQPPEDTHFNSFERYQSAIAKALDVAKDLLAEDQPAQAEIVSPDSEGAGIAPEKQALTDLVPQAGDQQNDIAIPLAAEAPAIERRVIQQEMVKVAAPRLEELVNLAGETSIARGRVEQQVSEFGFALDEMEATIQRLQDQVRRMGIETDAQVLFRKEQIEASEMVEGFDPLEMDRYSQLQQLSRSLLESASDLQDLKTTLANKARDAETQLLEQSRINTDLQENMMRTRMVPFSRMVPRLRRMVRQLNDELGKSVQLKVANVDGEMDRTVMESILPSLEHMVRNSLDHGIESPETRTQAGKPEHGTITIDMAREGSDILIRLADDGRGLDLDAIRQRAIDLGLTTEESVLEEQEIIHFIFQPGFSTTAVVSKVSGRGVGMDVVNSQVRQLGGSIETRTNVGEGTRFTIRLPFTVSVNRAMMIRIGEDSYALPLNTVDGVVRVNPAELEHYYRFPDSRLEYAGGRYQVRYLGSLLNEKLLPKIDLAGDSVFLVLVHSETRLYAVQVDELLSSDEIVVKSLGPQFSSVPGLSGATVRGDGSVVVILDLLALLRARIAVGAGVELLDSEGQREVGSESSVSTVMVVDDSVTVRKVTGRLLEREGFRVITANDGVAALRLLQDEIPDVMLLDIEMPRMDGFEVASRVKGTSVWKEIPIIMITSRTGEKHRERAFSLGVDKYLGKPFQEDVLLQSIDEMLNALVE